MYYVDKNSLQELYFEIKITKMVQRTGHRECKGVYCQEELLFNIKDIIVMALAGDSK